MHGPVPSPGGIKESSMPNYESSTATRFSIPVKDGRIIKMQENQKGIIRYVVKALNGAILYRTIERMSDDWEGILIDAQKWVMENTPGAPSNITKESVRLYLDNLGVLAHEVSGDEDEDEDYEEENEDGEEF